MVSLIGQSRLWLVYSTCQSHVGWLLKLNAVFPSLPLHLAACIFLYRSLVLDLLSIHVQKLDYFFYQTASEYGFIILHCNYGLGIILQPHWPWHNHTSAATDLGIIIFCHIGLGIIIQPQWPWHYHIIIQAILKLAVIVLGKRAIDTTYYYTVLPICS